MRLSKSRVSDSHLAFTSSEPTLKSFTPKSMKARTLSKPLHLTNFQRPTRSSTRSIFKLPSYNKITDLSRSPNSRKSIGSPPVQLVSKCAYKTKRGSVGGQPKPHNQDAYLISPYLQGLKSQYLFGVFDGHGAYGHEVSQFIKSNLTQSIEYYLARYPTKSALSEGIEFTKKRLNESRIETKYSGSTLTIVMVRDTEVICANIGDSRAVMGRKVKNEWIPVPLSRDHKPELETEQVRILKAGGRVMPCINSQGKLIGPMRVWLPLEDIPGLAMSRSIGDKVAHTVGVTDKPEFVSTEIGKHDRFFIIASDGLWEFMTSEEAVKFVGNCIDIGKADSCCKMIVKEATSRWITEDSVIDDITVVIVFLKTNS